MPQPRQIYASTTHRRDRRRRRRSRTPSRIGAVAHGDRRRPWGARIGAVAALSAAVVVAAEAIRSLA